MPLYQATREITLEDAIPKASICEEMCRRVAEARGLARTMLPHRMSVREGVINAFHYGNKARPDKNPPRRDLTAEKRISQVLDEGTGFKLSDVPDGRSPRKMLILLVAGLFLMRLSWTSARWVFRQNGGAGNQWKSKKLARPREYIPNCPGGQTAHPNRSVKEQMSYITTAMPAKARAWTSGRSSLGDVARCCERLFAWLRMIKGKRFF